MAKTKVKKIETAKIEKGVYTVFIEGLETVVIEYDKYERAWSARSASFGYSDHWTKKDAVESAISSLSWRFEKELSA